MSEQFYNLYEEYQMKFFQLPKVFFTNPLYKELSNDSKLAYAILHDRLQLSIKNQWVDQAGDIYFIYSNANLCKILNVSDRTVTKIKKELTKANLFISKKQGFNQVWVSYLMKPIVTKDDVYNIDKLAEPANNASSSKTPSNQGSAEPANNASSNKIPSNQGSAEPANNAAPNPQNLRTNDTDLNDTKGSKGIEGTEDQVSESVKGTISNDAQDQILIDAYIQQYGLYEQYGEAFMNIILPFINNNFDKFSDVMKRLEFAIKSAEKESGYSIGVHFYESSTYSHDLREDFVKQLYSLLLAKRTDHKIKDFDSVFFTRFKKTTAHWIEVIKNDSLNRNDNY